MAKSIQSTVKAKTSSEPNKIELLKKYNSEIKELKAQKLLNLAYSNVSRKDLKAVARELLRALRLKGLEGTINHFKVLKDKKIAIKYYSNLKGLSHKNGLGPARAPLKCYNYVLDQLKGLKSAINFYTQKHKKIYYSQILVNNSTYKYAKGVRLGGRGRASREDARKFRLVIILKF